jgi:integrase
MPFSTGLLLGKINKGGRYVGQGMSATSIYASVIEYAERLSLALKPHDLRRTYGKLAHQGGAKIEQIQFSYRHASLSTTERYLGIDQDRSAGRAPRSLGTFRAAGKDVNFRWGCA